jgi:benzoate-CoA ligase
MTVQIDLPDQFNAAAHFLNLNPDAGRADKTYMICGDARMSYGEVRERSRRVAAGLRRLGVEPEQRVMLLMADTLNFPPCFWGTVLAGAVAIPVNTLLKRGDYRYFLEDSRARVLMVDPVFWPEVAPVLEGLRHLKHVVLTGPPADGPSPKNAIPLDELMREDDGEDPEPLHPEDAALWLYTSGSTGVPKAAVHLQRDLVVAADCYAKQTIGLREDDITFSAAKFFFAYGLGNSLYFPIAAGCTAVVYPQRPTPEAMFEQLHRHRPTVFYGVPTLYNAMLNTYEAWLKGQNAPDPLPNLDSLRFCVSAGESLPPETFQRWQRLFGSEILDGIGSTEMLHIFLSNRLGESRPGSTGKPVPGYETRIVDEAGEPVPDGEAGLLLVKGDSASPYYWNKHEKTKATMLGEWMVTGDRYIRDADGYFWYQGRNDDMMKVSGSWVSPVEVENALLSHEAVAECAVVAHVDSDGLTKPRAFVVLKQGQTGSRELADALKAHVKGNIAGFKTPRWIEFADDLPKTATGKIRRFALRG